MVPCPSTAARVLSGTREVYPRYISSLTCNYPVREGDVATRLRETNASREPALQNRGSGYLTSSPVTARPTIIRWISDVPSKMVKILAI
jgi:hypothetical protein